MAHELEVIDGNASMFWLGETPWHGLGTKLDTPPTVEEGIRLAGLDWKVERKQLVIEGSSQKAPAFATVRDSDSSILGVVGSTYRVLQNIDAFKWFQPYLDSGEVELHTAGSLSGGSRVWVLAKIKGEPVEIVKDDSIEQYVLLSNAHDGSQAVRAGLTATRVVCANTMAAAHNAASSKLMRVRHSEKAGIALEKVRDSLNLARREFAATADGMRQMARYGVSVADLNAYVREVFQPKVQLNVVDGAETSVTLDNLVENIIPLFEKGRGNDLPGVKGTMWAAHNAVTEYLSHQRGRNANNRVESLWFGQSANLIQRAYNVAVQMAA